MHCSRQARPLGAALLPVLLAFFLGASAPRPAAAIQPPAYSGETVVWYDDFYGPAGSAPDEGLWSMVTVAPGINNELETYTASPRNVQLSGGGTLQLVPWRDASAAGGGGWTSGRIESLPGVTPFAGRRTRVEAALRMGEGWGNATDPATPPSPANQQGIWPAFFLLGDAMRHGTQWPLCGELDILEQVNGEPTGFGTAHCTSSTAGANVCEEPTGRGSTVGIPTGAQGGADGQYHTWSLTWDLTSKDWSVQTITWALDGQAYFALSGAQLGDTVAWSTLAHSPYYIILNVAVGGTLPGNPNSATLDGYSSMLEAQYVAIYTE